MLTVFRRGRQKATCGALLVVLLLSAPAWADTKSPTRPVNINTATAAEIEQLPGIGPSIARAILKHRERHGPFRRLEDLLIVRGISRARLRRLRPHLVLK